MIVDVHTHIIMKEAFKEVRQRFPHIQTPKIVKDAKGEEYLLINGEATGPITRTLYTAEDRLKDMDTEGINLQVLSVVPFTFF